LQVGATPFSTSAKSKAQAITALQLLLENRMLRADWSNHERGELLAYQWEDKRLQQDCIISLAIAAWSIQSGHDSAVTTLAQRQNISQW
jgi:hypothetical protein